MAEQRPALDRFLADIDSVLDEQARLKSETIRLVGLDLLAGKPDNGHVRGEDPRPAKE